MPRVPPSYPRYPQRFMTATATWDPFEVGCYQLLLDVQWDLGEQGLPDDLDRLAAAVRCPPREMDRFLRAWEELLEDKFPRGSDGRRRNEFLEELRADRSHFLETQRRKGAAGGKAAATARAKAAATAGAKAAAVAFRSPDSVLRSPDSDLQEKQQQRARVRADQPVAEIEELLDLAHKVGNREAAAEAVLTLVLDSGLDAGELLARYRSHREVWDGEKVPVKLRPSFAHWLERWRDERAEDCRARVQAAREIREEQLERQRARVRETGDEAPYHKRGLQQ